MATIVSVTKEGQKVVMMCDNGRSYLFDFGTGVAIGMSHRPLKSTNTVADAFPRPVPEEMRPMFRAMNALGSLSANYAQTYAAAAEGLLSYPDLMGDEVTAGFLRALSMHHNSKLPKGYVKYLRENNKRFGGRSLEDFKVDRAMRVYPAELSRRLKLLMDNGGINLLSFTEDKDLLLALIHIVDNSLKLYQWNNLSRDLQNIVQMVTGRPELRAFLDDTKCAKVAYEILDAKIHEQRNKYILDNEARLLPLNGHKINFDGQTLIVKIPTDMEDFTDEGNQQHNCVGYYYHDYMASGRALIYFLRRADKPEKSFITCRFSPDARRTVEHRTMNNCNFNHEVFFDKLDGMINALL